VILDGLTTAQVKFIKHIASQIEECEGDIPTKNWCPSCLSKFQRIAELVKRFRCHRRLRDEFSVQQAVAKAYNAVVKPRKDPRWPDPRKSRYWDSEAGTYGFL